MSFWFWHGLRKGIQTTRYPQRAETAPGVSPGRPVNTEFESAGEAQIAAEICPADAIVAHGRFGIRGSRQVRALPALPPFEPLADGLGFWL